jgi:hypothetical protein
MIEAAWFASLQPPELIGLLRRRSESLGDQLISSRKRRLFAAACCRAIWQSLPDERCRAAVEVAERFADGCAGSQEIADCSRQLYAVLQTTPARTVSHSAVLAALAALEGTWERASWNAYYAGAKKFSQCRMVRDIFGNPFRLIAIDPSWRTPQVVALAQAMYEDRRFEDMPFLADAWEEAGCSIEELLCHCREPGLHVRGCWVVDLALGRP